MAECVPASLAGGVFQEPAGRVIPLFSATTLIGGMLRALYDEFQQPGPSRLTQLLRALDDRGTA